MEWSGPGIKFSEEVDHFTNVFSAVKCPAWWAHKIPQHVNVTSGEMPWVYPGKALLKLTDT